MKRNDIQKLTDEQWQLVNDNTKLIWYTVKMMNFYVEQDELQDIYSVGYIGLAEAASLFKSELGYKFSTFAIKYIYGRIKTYLERCSDRYHGVKIPNSVFSNIRKISKASENEDLDIEELSKITGLSVDEVMDTKVSFVSKDALIDYGSGHSVQLEDILDSEDISIDNLIESDYLDYMLNYLKKNMCATQYSIIKYMVDFYNKNGENCKISDVCIELGVSHTTVNNVKNSAYKWLTELNKNMTDTLTIKRGRKNES